MDPHRLFLVYKNICRGFSDSVTRGIQLLKFSTSIIFKLHV
jgi:hypothetical protein